jgi:hypothetical protein
LTGRDRGICSAVLWYDGDSHNTDILHCKGAPQKYAATSPVSETGLQA